MRSIFSKTNYVLFLLICAFSIAQFTYFLVQNYNVNYYDEEGYYFISNQIIQNGLFNLTEELRTYLYPLILSLFYVFTDGSLSSHKILVSIFQYAVLIFTVLLIAKTAFNYSKSKVVFLP
ncbi:hypothetical protein DFP95_110107 [Cohnella lupini]|uniref:Dolichyl-phosphate-mannose-protein mannosyltransferase n=1 Tax=Cohnella lupini TaxID=1294267 RepID=A0A3D9I766_9BACL|nr:hypothetical protein DFP95_110107 [Cohnella lupini]